jgi:hypothetical protein
LPDAEKAQRFRDAGKHVVLATILFAIGLFALVWIRMTVSTNILVGQDISHATLPSVWSSLLALLALLYGLRASYDLIVAWRALQADGDGARAAMRAGSVDWLMFGRLSGTVVMLVIFALLLEAVPFIVLTTAFLFVIFLIYGQPLRLRTAVLAVLGGAGFHGLFVEFLKLPL